MAKRRASAAEDPEVEETEEVTAEKVVAPDTDATAKAVADAAAGVEEAKVALDAAKDIHAVEVQKTIQQPVAGQHIVVEGAVVDAPADYDHKSRPYRLNINGSNYEHTHDHPTSGVWCYSRKP